MYIWMIVKNSIKIIMWTRRVLQLLKYERYYWYRLGACKKSKDFEIKNLGEYHDLYVQSNTWCIENFRNMCLRIYELDPAKFLSAPGLSWQAAFKKTK